MAIAGSLLALGGLAVFWSDTAIPQASEEGGSGAAIATPETQGVKLRSRSDREAQSAEVWTLIQSRPPNESLKIIDKNWSVLGGERAKGFYCYVLNKAMDAGKLGDAELLEGVEHPELKFVISSRVARTLIEEDLDGAITFILSLPEENHRSDVIGDALTTSATPGKLASQITSLESWMQKEPTESVRRVLWNKVYSKLAKSGDKSALKRWGEAGEQFGIVESR